MTPIAVSALAGHQFLHGMPTEDVAILAGMSSLVTYPAGHRLFDTGGVARHFWLVRAGQVALELYLPGRGRVVIETIGRGEMVGLSWLTPPYQWEYVCRAMQPTEAFQFDAAAVQRHCDSDPAFGYEFHRRVIAVVVKRLQATRARLIEVYSTADIRD